MCYMEYEICLMEAIKALPVFLTNVIAIGNSALPIKLGESEKICAHKNRIFAFSDFAHF